MTWKLDTETINASSVETVGNIQEESLAVYCFLLEQWNEHSVIENKLFQFVFRSFYRLDNAGLTDEFKKKYFELLEAARSYEPSVKDICETLFDIKNRKGSKSLQFSFATKLANTVNPILPIYDSEVAKMYGYKSPLPYKSLDQRIENLMKFYEHLASDYSKILENGSLETTLIAFDQRFPSYRNKLVKNKKLDFVVWSAGKLSKK
jgi:hypothetical protein